MMPNTKKNKMFTNPIKIWTVNYKLLNECSELSWEEIINKLNKNKN